MTGEFDAIKVVTTHHKATPMTWGDWLVYLSKQGIRMGTVGNLLDKGYLVRTADPSSRAAPVWYPEEQFNAMFTRVD